MSGRGRGSKARTPGANPSKTLLKRTAQEAGLPLVDPNNRQVIMSLTERIVRPPLFPDISWHSSGSSLGILGTRAREHQGTTNTKSNGGAVAVKEEPVDETAATTTTSAIPVKSEASIPATLDQNNNIDDDVQIIVSQEPVPLKRSSHTVNLIQKQRALMDAFQKSSHYIRPHQTIDIVRYSENGGSQHLPTLLGDAACLEQYFPLELLSDRPESPRATSAGLDTNAVVDASSKNQEEEDDFNEEPTEEAEEVEDYTMNYYASDDDVSDGGDGGEAIF